MQDKEYLVKEILKLHTKLTMTFLTYQPEPWLKLNLTIDQLKIMIILRKKQQVSFKELAEMLNINQSNITGIADRLEKQNLVQRIQNPNDRRMQFMVLTENGIETLKNLRDSILYVEKGILETMTLEGLSALSQGMNALYDACVDKNSICTSFSNKQQTQ